MFQMRIAKMKIYILAPAQAKRMQPILVSCLLRAICKNPLVPHWINVLLQIAPKWWTLRLVALA